MKTVGIIGGMSWESTVEYYKIINELVAKKLGGLHSAKILLESYDFDTIAKLQQAENWDELSTILVNSARMLENAGADYIAVATNTMHICAPVIEKSINIPLIHIGDATAKSIIKNNLTKVLLLGTKYTMTKEFYRGKLQDEYNIDVVVPDSDGQQIVNSIIFDELCQGVIKDTSEAHLQNIIELAAKDGAQAVVLGCTELPNIIKSACIPIINTLQIHCEEIADKITAF